MRVGAARDRARGGGTLRGEALLLWWLGELEVRRWVRPEEVVALGAAGGGGLEVVASGAGGGGLEVNGGGGARGGEGAR